MKSRLMSRSRADPSAQRTTGAMWRGKIRFECRGAFVGGAKNPHHVPLLIEENGALPRFWAEENAAPERAQLGPRFTRTRRASLSAGVHATLGAPRDPRRLHGLTLMAIPHFGGRSSIKFCRPGTVRSRDY